MEVGATLPKLGALQEKRWEETRQLDFEARITIWEFCYSCRKRAACWKRRTQRRINLRATCRGLAFQLVFQTCSKMTQSIISRWRIFLSSSWDRLKSRRDCRKTKCAVSRIQSPEGVKRGGPASVTVWRHDIPVTCSCIILCRMLGA